MSRSSIKKFFAKLTIFSFVFQVIFSMTVVTPSSAVSDGVLSLDVTARNVTANQGTGNYRVLAHDNSEIILEYKIEGKPFEVRQDDKKTEIALVLDVSSSMNELPRGSSSSVTKINNLKEATESFIDRFKERDDVYITIVPFFQYSNPDEYFISGKANEGAGGFFSPSDSNGYAILKDQAVKLSTARGTNIGDGLRVAYHKLKNSPYNTNSNKYIVLMTDGAPTYATSDFSITTPGFNLASLYGSGEFEESVMKGPELVTNATMNTYTGWGQSFGYSNEYAKIIAKIVKDDPLKITPFFVAYDHNEGSTSNDIANALGVSGSDILFANGNASTDLNVAFNKIVDKIPLATEDIIPMTVDFSSELPFGINIDHILSNELGVGDYEASIDNNSVRIKIGDDPEKNFIIDVNKKANGPEGPSSEITGRITNLPLRRVSGNIYKTDDVIISIRVVLKKPEGKNLVQILRVNSSLNYDIPDPTDPSGSVEAPVVNANNNVVLSVVSVEDSLIGTKTVIDPVSSTVDVAKTVEIEYKLTGTVSLTVPSFPPTPTATIKPTPSITPTSTIKPTPVSPTERPKEIFFLLDSSTDYSLGQSVISPALNYVLYSLTDLRAEGIQTTINGSIYTNDLFSSSVSKFEVNGGTIECRESKIEGNDEVVSHLTSRLKEANQTITVEDLDVWQQIQNDAKEVQANAQGVTLSPNVSIRVERVGTKNVYTIFGGGVFYLNRDYYFDGDLIISLNNIVGDGKSFMLAEGDIIVQGETAANKTYEKISLFSKDGSIKFESSNSRVTGMAIAPDGDIVFQGRENDFEGNFIGGNIIVKSEDSVFTKPTRIDNNDVVNKYWNQNPHYEVLARALRGLIGFYDKHKIGVIQYSDSASSDFNEFKLYDMSKEEEKSKLDKHIEENFISYKSDKSNLGDALRRAYLSFEDNNISDPGASKYIIVLTGKGPNIYSADDPVNPPLIGDAYDFVEDNDKAVEYAESYADMLSLNTKALFVDLTKFTNEQNDALRRVASTLGVDLDTGYLIADYQAEEGNAYECIDDVLRNNSNSVKSFIDKVDEVIVEPEATIPDANPSPEPTPLTSPSPEPTEPNISTINVTDKSFYFTETLPSGVIPKSVKIGGTTYDFVELTSSDDKYFDYTFTYEGNDITRRWTATYNSSLKAYTISGYIPCRLEQKSPDGSEIRTYEVLDTASDESPKFSLILGFDKIAVISAETRIGSIFLKTFNFTKGNYTFDVIDPEQILSNCNPISGEFSPELDVIVKDAIDVN